MGLLAAGAAPTASPPCDHPPQEEEEADEAVKVQKEQQVPVWKRRRPVIGVGLALSLALAGLVVQFTVPSAEGNKVPAFRWVPAALAGWQGLLALQAACACCRASL
jgi:hypothetical protein